MRSGTPPRVRGAGRRRRRRHLGGGNTPACAGSSCAWQIGPDGWREHPRVCGEQPAATTPRAVAGGTPPRVRGAAVSPGSPAAAPGNTPACAGSRAWPEGCATPRREHPRVCGEQLLVLVVATSVAGTPSRVRGAGGARRPRAAGGGNTPACAGSRTECASRWAPWWEHPRVCGEQDLHGGRRHQAEGTPPRVRGAVVEGEPELVPERNTPARAGSRARPGASGRRSREHPRVCGEQSPPRCCSSRSRREHPRVCGEQRHYVEPFAGGLGTPPRVRGAASVWPGWLCRSGNTPACAGSRPVSCRTTGTRREHPRVCGEQQRGYGSLHRRRGTPPRVRGADVITVGRGMGIGNTPACAGSRVRDLVR